jgi:uncharacterized protein YbaR (Trm112 family)
MSLPSWLTEILVCPESKEPLLYFEPEGFLYCPASRLKYRIEDDIPVLLVEEAERVPEEEARRLEETARQRDLPGGGGEEPEAERGETRR